MRFLMFSYNHHHIASLLILLVIVFGCCNVVRIVNIIIFKYYHQNFAHIPRLCNVRRIGTMIKVVAMLIYVNYMYTRSLGARLRSGPPFLTIFDHF